MFLSGGTFNKGTFLCDICGFSSSFQNSYQRHLKNSHSIVQTTCIDCAEVFNTLEELNIHRQQNSQSTYFDLYTSITKTHASFKNHANMSHDIVNCKDSFSLNTVSDIKGRFNDLVCATNGTIEKSKCKLYGNITAPLLLEFRHILDYITPLMHIRDGVGQNLIKICRSYCQKLDYEETECAGDGMTEDNLSLENEIQCKDNFIQNLQSEYTTLNNEVKSLRESDTFCDLDGLYEKISIVNERIEREKLEMTHLCQKRDSGIGKHEKEFEECLKRVGCTKSYLGKDVFVGSMMCKIYKDILDMKFTIIQVFKDNFVIYQKLKCMWYLLSTVHKYFSTPLASKDDKLEVVNSLEKIGKLFPVFFPDQNITRKIHIISSTIPKMILNDNTGNICYLYLKIEQASERLHSQLNNIEIKFNHMGNKSIKLLKMVQEYENQAAIC